MPMIQKIVALTGSGTVTLTCSKWTMLPVIWAARSCWTAVGEPPLETLSGEDRRLSAGDQVKVYGGSEPRTLEGVDHPLGVHLDVLGQAVLLRPAREQHLEHLAVLDGHDDVQVRHVVERVAAVVDLEAHVERFGEVRGLHERRDAALHGRIAAQIIRGARHDPRRQRREATRRVLGGEDRDRELLLELD